MTRDEAKQLKKGDIVVYLGDKTKRKQTDFFTVGKAYTIGLEDKDGLLKLVKNDLGSRCKVSPNNFVKGIL